MTVSWYFQAKIWWYFWYFLTLSPGQVAGGSIMFSGCPSVRSSVRTSFEHDILKPISMQICESGLCSLSWGSESHRSRSYGVEIGHKNPFWRDFSINRPGLLVEFQPNLAGTYYNKSPLYHNNWDAKGQSHTSPKIYRPGGGIIIGPVGSTSFSCFCYF